MYLFLPFLAHPHWGAMGRAVLSWVCAGLTLRVNRIWCRTARASDHTGDGASAARMSARSHTRGTGWRVAGAERSSSGGITTLRCARSSRARSSTSTKRATQTPRRTCLTRTCRPLGSGSCQSLSRICAGPAGALVSGMVRPIPPAGRPSGVLVSGGT